MGAKKVIATLSTVGLTASFMLAGCGNTNTNAGNSGNNTTSSNDQVTLKLVEVITSPQRTKLLQSIIDSFEKQNPNIKVDIVSLPWESSGQQLLAMVQGGQAPDVVEMPDKWIGQYAAMGDLQDLSQYINNWDGKDQMTDMFWTAAKIYKNTPYTLPYGFYLRALFYNKPAFDQAGLQPPTSFPEFMSDAQKLTDASKGQYGYDLRGGPGSFDSVDLFLSAYLGTGDWFDSNGKSLFNKPEAVQAVTDLASLYKYHYAPPGSVTAGFNEIVNSFYSNHGMMLDQDPDTLESVEQNMKDGQYGTAPLPVGPKGVTFPKVGFAGWSMFSSSKYKDADWKLISFLENYDNTKQWEMFAHNLPVYKKAQTDKDFNDPNLKAWFSEVNDTEHYKITFYPFQLPELGQFLDQIAVTDFQKVLQGQMTPQQACDKWADYLTTAEQKWMSSNK